jgi:hypothetical protein
MTDSGRFISAEMWAEAEAARAATAGGLPLSPPVRPIDPPGTARKSASRKPASRKPADASGISAALSDSVSREDRPKAPDGSDILPPPQLQLPGPPPRPPRVPLRLRFTPFLKKLAQKLRSPLSRRAAL